MAPPDEPLPRLARMINVGFYGKRELSSGAPKQVGKYEPMPFIVQVNAVFE